jgi:chromosomal replication initiation ATPase DnaA
MKTIQDFPGLQEALDECQTKVQDIIGKPVTVSFKLKIHTLTTERLANIICEVCEVPWHLLKSESRKGNIVIARHMFCFFAATVQRKTLWSIAQVLHRTDHTTIVHARNKIKDMIETKDGTYYPIYLAIEEKINELILA